MTYDFFITALLQGLAYSALGLGIFLSLRIFNIPDITTDGSYTLGGAITATLLVTGMNPFATLFFAVSGGMIAGALTGLIITRLKIHPLLAGILVMTSLYSINLLVMGRSNIPLINTDDIYSVFSFNNRMHAVETILIIVSCLLTIIITWLLKSDFGIAMRATGNSEAMVRAMGVNTNSMKVIGLSLANGLTALSGYLMSQYQGFSDINMGIGIVVSGLGAVMIGETIMQRVLHRGIIYSIIAVIAGSILFRLIIAAALSLGLNPNYLRLITAVIVLVIVSFSLKKLKVQ